MLSQIDRLALLSRHHGAEQPSPTLDTRSAGNGPKQTAMWLKGKPCIFTGQEAWPKVGDRLLIDGEPWRLVEISDRWVCEREPS